MASQEASPSLETASEQKNHIIDQPVKAPEQSNSEGHSVESTAAHSDTHVAESQTTEAETSTTLPSDNMDVRDAPAIDFVTLGMFILDDIHPPPTSPTQTPSLNIPGGAGTYSALGARIFSPSPHLSPSVGWIVDYGPDFPSTLRDSLLSLQTSLLLRPRPNNQLTTRGWNGYTNPSHRSFAYLTEKKRLGADDLDIRLLRSKSFHLICGAARCTSTVQAIIHRRKAVFGPDEPHPFIIWEPVPDLCTPAEFDATMKALKSVDVISPNHEELASLFGFSHDSNTIDKAAIEYHASALLSNGVGPTSHGAIVVRASHEGCYVLSPTVSHWLPAYHNNASRVVDPTGGGNGFLGGFAVGLVRTGGDVVEAARMGSVSASFCIEQVGLPQVQVEGTGGCMGGRPEKWNGVSVLERLLEFRNRRAGQVDFGLNPGATNASWSDVRLMLGCRASGT